VNGHEDELVWFRLETGTDGRFEVLPSRGNGG
jgi:hypothetical protein